MKPLSAAPVHHDRGVFTGAVQLLFLFNLVWSRSGGASARQPLAGTSLEWSPSPPPSTTSAAPLPVVYHGPYQYGMKARPATT